MADKAEQEKTTTQKIRPGSRGHHHMNFEKPKDSKASRTRLLRYMKELTPILLGSMVFLVTAVLLQVTAPTVLGNAITDHLERSLDLSAFLRQMIILSGIYLSMFASRAVSSVMIAHASNRLIYKMRKDGFEKLQRLSLSYYDRAGVGDIISRMTNDIETVYNAFSNGFSSVLSGTLSIIGTLAAMFILNIPLSFAVLSVVPFALLFVILLGRRVKVRALENQKQVGGLNTAIEESVEGMKIIQTFHQEQQQYEGFSEVNAKARDAAIDFFVESYKMMPMMELMNGISLALVVAIGGTLVIISPELYSIGLISAFILYAKQFFEPIRQLSNIYNMLQSALAGAERFFQIIDTDDMISEPEHPVTAEEARGDVAFEQVDFSYVTGTPVLEQIAFSASSGSVTAIVGPTGAGKTTIINLLNRFYDVDAGRITVDGRDIRDYRLSDLRAMMGVVLQEPFFFAGSIRENLMYGRLEASEQQMIEAATLANAHHFISCLPEGYDTILTERGMNLSQGERQLLAIARTILADPKILILDEATSNIDSLTEAHIQQAMKHLMTGKTSLVIAHRLSTIKNADQLLVIHDHTIIEQGTHQELMAQQGFYSRLYSIQFEQARVTEDMSI